MVQALNSKTVSREIVIAPNKLPGTVQMPESPFGLVIFAHGSGSSRLSPRNTMVAQALNRRGLATLLFDLLHPTEEAAHNRAKVFDIALLSDRLGEAIRWVDKDPQLRDLPTGLFGASTGAAAALVAAAESGDRVGAVVSRGGRPDMAGEFLAAVQAPTLLIVGGEDHGVIELNQSAYERLGCVKTLEIVSGATHLFPEQGAMERVIHLAENWFDLHLRPSVV